jgi:hypothetical protein
MAIENLDDNLDSLLSIFHLETTAKRKLTPVEAPAAVEFSAPQSPRDSRFSFSFYARFRFLGLDLELPEINFELYGLNRINWNDYRVLSELPAIVLKELSRNILAMIKKVLDDLGRIFWHLVRFVFDADFRAHCLTDTMHSADVPQLALLTNEMANNDLKQDESIKAKLIEAGWTSEEIDVLRTK